MSAIPTELPPSTQQLLFARAVILTFQLWPSMRTAISQEWGGPDSKDKADFIISHICDTCGGPSGSTSLAQFEPSTSSSSSSSTSPPPSAPETPDQDDLAETLEGYLADEFEARIEDDSCDFIANRIVSLHKIIFAKPVDDSEKAARDVIARAEEVIRPLQEAADKQRPSRDTDQYQSQPGFESDSDDGDSDSDDNNGGSGGRDDMDVDQPSRQPKQKQEPIVDDDGFTTVQRKR